MVRIKLSMLWLDDRIKANFSHKYEKDGYYDDIKFRKAYYCNPLVSLREAVGIWYPDFEFENALKIKPASGNCIIRELNILRNNPMDGNISLIEMKADMWLTVKCKFDFSSYPMDSQSCNVLFSNKEGSNINFHLYDPKQYQPFDALGYTMKLRLIDGTCGCNNYQAGFKITMHRIINPFVFKSYCPVIAIVLISSITFIIPLSSIPGRVGLAATLFLTLTNIFITSTVMTYHLPFLEILKLHGN